MALVTWLTVKRRSLWQWCLAICVVAFDAKAAGINVVYMIHTTHHTRVTQVAYSYRNNDYHLRNPDRQSKFIPNCFKFAAQIEWMSAINGNVLD